MTLPSTPGNEQHYQQDTTQDTIERINHWLDILEERITTLLEHNDPETMKPGEREQAVSRHLTLIMRLLQLRHQFASARTAPDEQAILDALLHHLPEE